MQYSEKLIPSPQVIEVKKGEICLKKLKTCRICGIGEGTLKELKREFSWLEFSKGNGEKFTAGIASSEKAFGRYYHLQSFKKQGAYVLDINKDAIWIKGYDESGLWNAFQTLVQLNRLSCDGRIPLMKIVDYPAIELRGIHLDLKGYQPKLDVIMDELRLLASYKINCVLLELEDKVQYNTTPGTARPGAFTKSELHQIGNLCKALHIELIPKLQCLGHMDYLLKYPKYAALRENNHPYQYCPSNPESFNLWKSLCNELVEALPYIRYFHIGGDEAMYLGECKKCKQYSKADLYISHLKKCINYVKAKNKEAIMWDDLVRNLHGTLGEEGAQKAITLGKDAILMYWAYGYGEKGNEFPHLARYLSNDLTIWGASAFSGCGPSWVQNIPPFPERALNIDAWTQAAILHNLKAIVCTGWGRLASADPPAEPFEACWLPMLYSAESMWSGKSFVPKKFAARFAFNFFGITEDMDETQKELFAKLDQDYQPFLSEFQPTHQPNRFKLLIECNKLALHKRKLDSFIVSLQMYRTSLIKKSLADYRVEMLKKSLKAFDKERNEFMKEIQQILSKFYTADTVNVFMDSRFGIDLEITERLKSLLSGNVL